MAQERNRPSKKGAEVLARIADGFTLRKSALGGATLRKGTLRFRVAEATLGKLVREGHLLEARDDDGRVIYLPPSRPEPAKAQAGPLIREWASAPGRYGVTLEAGEAMTNPDRPGELITGPCRVTYSVDGAGTLRWGVER